MLSLKEKLILGYGVRVWFNTPSINDRLHGYHGKVGIAFYAGTNTARVYFTSGPVLSGVYPIASLAEKVTT